MKRSYVPIVVLAIMIILFILLYSMYAQTYMFGITVNKKEENVNISNLTALFQHIFQNKIKVEKYDEMKVDLLQQMINKTPECKSPDSYINQKFMIFEAFTKISLTDKNQSNLALLLLLYNSDPKNLIYYYNVDEGTINIIRIIFNEKAEDGKKATLKYYKVHDLAQLFFQINYMETIDPIKNDDLLSYISPVNSMISQSVKTAREYATNDPEINNRLRSYKVNDDINISFQVLADHLVSHIANFPKTVMKTDESLAKFNNTFRCDKK